VRRSVGIAAGLLAIAVLVVGAWGWRQWTRAPSARPERAAQLVRIPQGMTLAAAADTLVARGLLADRAVLLVGARLSGRARALRAGLYEIPAGLAPRDLLEILVSGRSLLVRVTIPEGLDAEEIADVLAGTLGIAGARFLAVADSLVRAHAAASDPDAAARHDSLLARESRLVPRRLRWCEGYLAPDTYLFAADSGPDELAAHLVSTQYARVAAVRRGSGLDDHALLTLASIVEAEARRADERARIAAVYANRLRAGWRLEADPTVAYVLDKKGQRLFYKDLEVGSAWNTYRRRGLPPGPIGNPGEAALAAAAAPDTACDALYFVSDGDDGHVFSRTAAEHERAVREFRRRRGVDRRRGRD
jgi:UPF0755 protein